MRVLIAEDELILAFTMRGQLEQRGVEVVGIAKDGRAAYERCQELRPDVVLMDVRMPGTNGIDGTRLIMEHAATCVIIVTAYTDEETRARAEAAGAMGFLSKPLQAAGVLEEVPRAKARFAEFGALRAESADLEEALAIRSLVEAAKARLVSEGLAEATNAFAVLRGQARASGMPLTAFVRHVAEATTRSGTWPAACRGY